MQITFWAATDTGLTRDHNEDNFLVDRKLNLFIVADGMGGHAAGEIASSVAVHKVRSVIAQQREVIENYKSSGSVLLRQTVLTLIDRAISVACHEVHRLAQEDEERHGMGTTLSMLLVARDRGFVGHVGDSRIYRTRAQQVTQVTEDHSVINELIKSGRLKPGDEFNSPYKNAVTRAVGVHPTVEVDTFDFTIEKGDNYLLCSDGLSCYLEEEQQTLDFLNHAEIKAIPKHLIDHANACGGKDNITAIVVRAIGEEKHQTSKKVAQDPSAHVGPPAFDPTQHTHPPSSTQTHKVTQPRRSATPQAIPTKQNKISSEPSTATKSTQKEEGNISIHSSIPPPVPALEDDHHSPISLISRLSNTDTVSSRLSRAILNQLPLDLLKLSPLFNFMNEKGIEEFASYAQVMNLSTGQTLWVEGESDEHLYVLIQGTFKVIKDQETIDHLHVGAVLGESHLLADTFCPVNLVSEGECKVLAWSRYAIYGFLSQHHHFAVGFMWGLSQMLYHKSVHIQQQYDMAQDILQKNSLFTLSETPHYWALYPSIQSVSVGESLLPKFLHDLKEQPHAIFNLSIEELIEQGQQWQDESEHQDVLTRVKESINTTHKKG